MKYITTGLLLLLMGCKKDNTPANSADLACIPADLQTGILAFYPFSNGSLDDYSGNNFHLTNTTTASPGTDREGNPDCAFRFAAANGDVLKYINPAFLDNLQSGSMSISLWYCADAEQGGSFISRGADPGNPHGGFGEWSMGLYDNNWPVFFINSRRTIGVPAIPGVFQTWHHVTVTSDNVDLKVYQDGVLIGDAEIVVCNCTPTLSGNLGDMFIGRNFSGKLDDIIIYNRLLNSAEVTALYNAGACCE